MKAFRTLHVQIDGHVLEPTAEICDSQRQITQRVPGFAIEQRGVKRDLAPGPDER